MKKTLAAAAVFMIAFANSAKAAQDGEYIPYVGIDYTYTDANVKYDRPHYNSGSVNIGTYYNKFFGTEMFYQRSDSHKEGHGADKSKTSFQAYGLDLMGYLPLGCDQTFALIGTVGIGEYIVRNQYSLGKGNRDHGIGYRAGAGVLYNVDENWGIRVLARYVNLNHINDYDHMMEYSAGVRYTF